MSNYGLFETITGFEGWLYTKGRMCQKKLSVNKQLAVYLKMHISHIIYSKFGQLCTIF
jgi:hypothetical protein